MKSRAKGKEVLWRRSKESDKLYYPRERECVCVFASRIAKKQYNLVSALQNVSHILTLTGFKNGETIDYTG